jgi:streptogramin lyase
MVPFPHDRKNMFRKRILRSLANRRDKRSRTGPGDRRFRAGVEGLEDRALLATHLTQFPVVVPGVGEVRVSSITHGPDGNFWFTAVTAVPPLVTFSGEVVGKVTPTGQVTTFPVSSTATTPGLDYAITTGPDGNLWFTTDTGIERITPAGIVTKFSTPQAVSLTAGPDGNLWFTGQSVDASGSAPQAVVGKITPSGQVTTFPIPGLYSGINSIARGGDGQLWFLVLTNPGTMIESVTTSGQVTARPLPPVPNSFGTWPSEITTGPDGNAWVLADTPYYVTLSGRSRDPHMVIRFNPSGTFKKFPVASVNWSNNLTSGPCQLLSFWANDHLAQITLKGEVTQKTVPLQTGQPPSGIAEWGLATDSDGNVWFFDNGDNSSPSQAMIDRLSIGGKRRGH